MDGKDSTLLYGNGTCYSRDRISHRPAHLVKKMEELIKLLKDGRSRTFEMLAMDLGTSIEKVKRDIEFLENMGVIKRIEFKETCSQGHSCDGCTGCGTGNKACVSCMPEGGFQNMGTMWEVRQDAPIPKD